MQQSVLKDFPKADISVSIVWIQMPGFNDNETTARKIAASLDDPRVRHFYDPLATHRAGKAFAEGIIQQGAGPAWDIYFFYKPGKTWDDQPPQPDEWMHQLGGGRRADATRFHAGQDLIEQLHKAMHEVTGQQCADP